MGRGIVFALLVVCLAAIALSAEGRSHRSFSAATYYDWNDTAADVIPSKDEKAGTESQTDDPNMRYPLGHYPGQKHLWNPKTESYETVNETGTDPNMRYPLGHYPGQKHMWNPKTESYETVNETDTGPNMRYPFGHYPGQTHVWNSTTESYETVEGTGVDPKDNPSKGRYEHGYYDEAINNYSKGDTLDVVKSQTSYTESQSTVDGTHNRYTAGYYYGHSANPTTYQNHQSESQTAPDLETFDPDQGRYKYGYYSSNAPKKTAGSKPFMSLASQDSTAGTDVPGERYPYGYYGQNAPKTTGERYRYGYYGQNAPKGTGSTGQFKPLTYSSYTGNFQTLPYPGSGTPYVGNGDGCRTAYWAEHTGSWPAFVQITATVPSVFGTKAAAVYGQTTVLEALLDYSSDPYKMLVRSACTSILNSYGRGKFPLSPILVIEEFTAALVSKEAAAKQALVFETVNVESIAAGNACT